LKRLFSVKKKGKIRRALFLLSNSLNLVALYYSKENKRLKSSNKMNRLTSFSTLLLFLTFFVSCEPEDIINTPNAKLDVVGFWTAGSVDIAPILADSISLMTLRFRTDSTFTITQTNIDGLITSFSGSYSVAKDNGSNDIYPIFLDRTSPINAKFAGIFEINDVIEPEELTFEMVQTMPNIGFTPPTTEFGFGSTNDGNLGTTNISRFQRVE